MRHGEPKVAASALQLLRGNRRRAALQLGRPRLDSPENLGYAALDLCQQVHRRLLPSCGWGLGRASYVVSQPPKKSVWH